LAEGCRIDCAWDRPVKPLAQPSRHFLLVRISGSANHGASSHPGGEAGAPSPQAPAAQLHLAIALDASRSMEEQGRFASCVAACAALAGRLTASDSFELAVFSKDLRPQLGPRAGGSEAAGAVAAALAAVRPRGVTRTDLALKWCRDRLKAADGQLKLALLVTDGDPTDDMGYPVDADQLLDQARLLAGEGAQLCTAGVGSAEAYNAAGLQALAAVAGGQFIYCAEAATLAARLLSRLPAGEQVWSGVTRLRLASRQAGLDLRSAQRLRPLPASLEVAASAAGSWEFDPGPLYARQPVDLLLELRLPPAAFGTGEGLNPILGLALEATGAETAQALATLDYSADPARIQQLNATVDQERRQWELRGHATELQELSGAVPALASAAEALLCRIEDAARYSGHRRVAEQAAQQVAELRQTGFLTRSAAAELAEAARAAQATGDSGPLPVSPAAPVPLKPGLVLEWDPAGAPPPGGVP
jgi:hypothetical protein